VQHRRQQQQQAAAPQRGRKRGPTRRWPMDHRSSAHGDQSDAKLLSLFASTAPLRRCVPRAPAPVPLCPCAPVPLCPCPCPYTAMWSCLRGALVGGGGDGRSRVDPSHRWLLPRAFISRMLFLQWITPSRSRSLSPLGRELTNMVRASSHPLPSNAGRSGGGGCTSRGMAADPARTPSCHRPHRERHPHRLLRTTARSPVA
jgi:hypothetical protein